MQEVLTTYYGFFFYSYCYHCNCYCPQWSLILSEPRGEYIPYPPRAMTVGHGNYSEPGAVRAVRAFRGPHEVARTARPRKLSGGASAATRCASRSASNPDLLLPRIEASLLGSRLRSRLGTVGTVGCMSKSRKCRLPSSEGSFPCLRAGTKSLQA